MRGMGEGHGSSTSGTRWRCSRATCRSTEDTATPPPPQSIAVTARPRRGAAPRIKVTGFAPDPGGRAVSLRAGSVGLRCWRGPRRGKVRVAPAAARRTGRLFTAAAGRGGAGAKLLRNLQASVGDTIVILSRPTTGPGQQRFRGGRGHEAGGPGVRRHHMMMSLTGARESWPWRGARAWWRSRWGTCGTSACATVRRGRRSTAGAARPGGAPVGRGDAGAEAGRWTRQIATGSSGILVVIVTFGILQHPPHVRHRSASATSSA